MIFSNFHLSNLTPPQNKEKGAFSQNTMVFFFTVLFILLYSYIHDSINVVDQNFNLCYSGNSFCVGGVEKDFLQKSDIQNERCFIFASLSMETDSSIELSEIFVNFGNL